MSYRPEDGSTQTEGRVMQQEETGRYQSYQGQGDYGYQGRQSGGPDFVQRHIETPETKEFFKTSEFFAFALAVAGVFIASSVVDGFDAQHAWNLITALTIGYMVSRGIAKAGARKGYDNNYR
jgi:hypothetical protein